MMNIVQEGKAAAAKAFRDRCLAEVQAGRKSVGQFLREMGVPETKLDWYEKRHELKQDQVFFMFDGSVVKLDRRVPGDGSAWYVAEWCNGWTYYDRKIEPGDLSELINTRDIYG